MEIGEYMSDSSEIRAFLAIDVDKALTGKILEVQEKLKEVDAPVKYVEGENLHFTLKFFGDINENKVQELLAIIEEKVNNFNPFEISIEKTGVFPSLRYIRVVWLGATNIEAFSELQKELDEEFIKMGFEKERSYIPHLTIGRLKGSHNKELLVEKIEELQDVEIGSMKIDKIVLKMSELTPSGPIYTDLKVFPL
jgi:2'-5' RNA ligase